MEIQYLHKLFLECSSVATDTRKIEKNSFFIALKGDRFDANSFANEALDLGAKYVVIDDKNFYKNSHTLLVKDSLRTLQDLAKYHRDYLNLKVIGLTGSNGKTTTKELINAVLSQKYSVKATVGNLNNHIGVPLTLLSFDTSTEIGIVEMGANHQKEIEFLCDIAQPDYGYITNFGKAHLEGFGGYEGVIKGKSEMYQFLKNQNGKVFINADDSIQLEKSNGIPAFTFSTKRTDADVFISKIEANPFVAVTFQEDVIQSQLVGIYNANNINAAITIGTYFHVDQKLIKEAIENYNPTNNRSQLSKKGSNQLILDAYNANPSSMTVALENLRQIAAPRKIAFLGDMFELGTESESEHRALVSSIKNDIETTFYFVGSEFYNVKSDQENQYFFETFEDLQKYISVVVFENSTILIKGSRGMALERVVDLL
ncbi:UDP-N-acetylmuramoyl-tripeptide--D-alanyl-D-alanine ligase [Flavobacterium tegetincola]|uniref:UDP-N-acetylmuramoyl-tripeptide--D-alanyl-D- alanine ligase n=1 Tax=Flavobacterium tegetincola TaxID=150172 RepID=UPI00041CA2E5|nr:UDP-N-acetylmuramoyl-tripeptide--D-alanyl-D-alanine ligase [Flavobacterium tegetincola]